MPFQRSGREHDRAVAFDREDDGWRDAALVEHVQRLVDDPRPQETEPGVDGEDVEAVVRDGAGRDGVDEMLRRSADPSAEPLVDVARERARRDAVEQLVADPVGLRRRAGRADRRSGSRRRSA